MTPVFCNITSYQRLPPLLAAIMFDVVIIGGGIAGLYAARCVLGSADSPPPRVALLERDSALGGRARTAAFAHVTVPTGAGIGRKRKDLRLQELAASLGVALREFPVTHVGSVHCPCDFGTQRRQFQALVDAYAGEAEPFSAYARRVLGGEEPYRRFVQCAGYSDYERADVADVLFNYGFEDNLEDWTGLAVPWEPLIQALEDDLGMYKAACTIMRNCTVVRLMTVSDSTHTAARYGVVTSQGLLRARAVVIATDIDAVRALLPSSPVFAHIHGQPFLRMYAKFSGGSAAAMAAAVRGVTLVPDPLQKVLPMSGGVYMVAYADNASALYMSTPAAARPGHVAQLLESALGLPRGTLVIDDLRTFFFPSGTHYNDPGLRAWPRAAVQHPLPNVFVVGEAVSEHQGWVEGALESVDAILPALCEKL